MSSTPLAMNTRVKLSAMMFLQYMMLPVWFVPLAAYLGKLQMNSMQMAAILSSMALGCLTSPLIGMFADRHFASQKVLAALNLVGAVLLFLSAQVTEPWPVFILLLLTMLVYMPTWGLTSSIAMSHSPAEKFPQIRVFGSIGWVASGVFSLVAQYVFQSTIDGTVTTLYCGAGVGVVAAVYALMLPHTPPPAKGQTSSVLDVLGLRSVSLMKERNFAIFIVVSMLLIIPFSMYWSYCSVFLKDKGFKFITVTMNWGQCAEMFFMLLIPLAIARVGLKWAMVIGLAAQVARYASFLVGEMFGVSELYFVAILVHGIIFGFFFVGGQIYIDRKAPKELRAQAQGFMFLATFGVGLLIGNFANGEMISRYSTTTINAPASLKLPATATFAPNALQVPGASLSDVKVYSRVLNDAELAVMAANETKAKTLTDEAKARGVVVDFAKDLVYTGDQAGLGGKAPGQKLTIVAKVTFPVKGKDDNGVSGQLLSFGEGSDALKLLLDKDMLVLQAGQQKTEARTVDVPRAKGANSMQVALTFDGKDIHLYTDGAAYTIYDWVPIWKITTIVSLVLTLVFIVAFYYKEEKQQAAPAPVAA